MNLYLPLRKRTFPLEYMDSWSSFDETSLPNKYSFYSNLNIENIIENDIKYAKKFP